MRKSSLSEVLSLCLHSACYICLFCWFWGYLSDFCSLLWSGSCVWAPAHCSQCQGARPCWPENSSSPSPSVPPAAAFGWGALGLGKGASHRGPTGLFRVYSTPQKPYSKDQLLSLVGFCSCAEVHSTRLLFAAHWCSRLAEHWHFYLEKDIISKEWPKQSFYLTIGGIGHLYFKKY